MMARMWRSVGGLLVLSTLLTTGCESREPEGVGGSQEPDRVQPLFTRMPVSHTGVGFANLLPETAARNGLSYEYYYNGGGVAVGDLNDDGLPDLYFTANMGPNRLYLNRGGLAFEDVTERAGVEGPMGGWATGVTFVDINADGKLDIYVSQAGPFESEVLRRNVLFINRYESNGIPVFTEEASAYGIADPAYSTQAAFFDSDADGDLDMYLMNHGIPAYRSLIQLQTGRSPFEIDKLYRNDGGRFVDVSTDAGLMDTNLGFGLGLSVADLNNDGLPDIYVGNDYSGPDYLYLGQPGGRFLNVLQQAMPHTPLSSMGTDFADWDGDGWLDLAVLEMDLPTHFGRKTFELGIERERFALLAREGLHFQYMANALQWNRGTPDGRVPLFSDVAQLAEVARTDWSWGPLFADLDNDGGPDLFVSNGMAGKSISLDFDEYMARRMAEVQAVEGGTTEALILELIRNMPRRKTPNHAFRNEGDLTFSDRTADWGLDHPSYSNGAVYSDLDRDGDLDLVVNNLQEEAFVYRNNSRETGGGHHLAIRFRGPPENPFGIGARVLLKAGGAQQMQELQVTRGYQSSVEPVLHFGLGGNTEVEMVSVRWPDGKEETLTGVAVDRTLDLDHANARAGVETGASPTPRLFTNAGDGLLPLPRHRASLSVLDPTFTPYPTKREQVALATGDLDGDGLLDFVFGGGGGEASAVYVQGDEGIFRAAAELPGSEAADGTAAIAIFDANGDSREDVWLVSTYKAGPSQPVHRHRLFLNAGGGRFQETPTAVPDRTGDGTVLAPGDFDGDGRVDLFVGHHVVPGTGPPQGSRLYRAAGDTFLDVTAEVAPTLAELGTVTDALWADLDENGWVDLLVAGEWTPITLLLNEGGRLRDATSDAGLETMTGWWQSLATADFDGDGDLDVVAGNIGLNYPYHPSPAAPFELYVGDLDGNGEEEALPAYWEADKLYPWYGRDRMATLLPWVSDLYPTLEGFARQTLSDIVGTEAMGEARRFEVRHLATSYLENSGGGRFRSRPLPRAAQVSVVASVTPRDFDGDGDLDLVLGGNLQAFDPSVPKLDAGVGLFLRGNGVGGFEPVPPIESGLWLEGAVRRLALLTIGPDKWPAVLAGVAGGEALLVRVAR